MWLHKIVCDTARALQKKKRFVGVFLVYPGFPLFWTNKIPWFFQVFSKFPGIFLLFLKYDFQVGLNINMETHWVSSEQKN